MCIFYLLILEKLFLTHMFLLRFSNFINLRKFSQDFMLIWFLSGRVLGRFLVNGVNVKLYWLIFLKIQGIENAYW